MKLKLKHLAPYLPYDLQVFEIDNQYTLDTDSLNYWNESPAEIKPILRPLDGKNFTSRDYTYNEWAFFFEQHYDVFGLIEKGLAIDINTLK